MQSLAVDTNLLVLLVYGRTAPQLIGVAKRVQRYSRDDYNILVEALSKSRSLVIIPQCIAEVSNLLRQGVTEPLKSRLVVSLKSLIEDCGPEGEKTVPSLQATAEAEFLRLGITDAAWLSALDAQTTMLTDDNDLYLAVAARWSNAINFSHLKTAASGADH